MGRRWGQLFFLAISDEIPARINMNAKSQILAHLIFRVSNSVCGMRLLLRLVITPPSMITIGKIHGVLKSRKVASAETSMIKWVMVLCTETRKAFQAA